MSRRQFVSSGLLKSRRKCVPRLSVRSTAPRVLTPHPGEMGRLLGRSTSQVQSDRVEAARALARRSGALTVLKGARTLIARPNGDLLVITENGFGKRLRSDDCKVPFIL